MADVGAKDSNGETPLHAAMDATACNSAIVSTLIAAGADINAKADNYVVGISSRFGGYTPLNSAIHRNYSDSLCPDEVRVLSEAGAKVCSGSDCSFYAWTPLFALARKSLTIAVVITMAQVLIQQGNGVNDRGVGVDTPLSGAWYNAANTTSGHGWFGLVDFLIENGGHYGVECRRENLVNPRRPYPDGDRCICPAETHTETNLGECEVVAVCDPPAVLDTAANRCDCPSPNMGADGADSPGECAAPSEDVCGGLTPPKHYDATAGECVPLAACRYEEVRNEETNTCECHAPNVRADYGRCRVPSANNCLGTSPPSFYSPTLSACAPYDECIAAGDCALSAHVCFGRGFSPAQFYDSETGECVSFVKCHSTATLNRGTNECECTASSSRRYMRPDGSCESSCIRAETAVWKGRYYECECPTTTSTDVNGVCEFLYPCHDSAIRKTDNSGCECPAGTFAHGDPSGGARYNSRTLIYTNSSAFFTYHDQDDYGQYEYIPDTAECHSASDGHHAPWTHDLEWTTAITLDGPEVVSHFIADHGRDPDANHDLYYAVEHGYYQAAKALIEGGADVDLRHPRAANYSYNDQTPLHGAVWGGRARIVTLLLSRGANADLADALGDTPLHLAARRSDTPENAALVSFLLDKGANPNIFNNRRWRPLDLADGRDGYPRRRKIMSALIAGGANWSDECVGGKVPNEFTPPKCKCPSHLSIDNNGLCECPAHSHSQVNGLCLPKDSAQVEGEIAKMRAELARLRAALVSLNARISLSAEMPREMVEGIAEQARETAAEIDWRRANFIALGRTSEAGAPPPPVALSDTAAECRMRGGEVRIDSGSGTRICLGLDQSGTFCLVDSGHAFPCRGLFKHVRLCNDSYNRPALNPFICAARCDADETARGKDCE